MCPSCGYSSSDEFSREFAPRTLNSIKEKICNNWGDLNYCEERSVDQAINTYKLGIYSALLKKEKHIAIAGLYLRLAWIYRTHSKEKEEHRFLNLALEEYLSSYMEDDFSSTHLSEIKLFYLIGELSRRTENDAQAIRYFSMVIEKQKDTTEKGIVEMAKEQWAEMRKQRKLG
ncbi:DUF2225 domain-containing protein [Metabacillus herbersteinensis]|uniref:DUF2225 domain-containing protein n=1 Tax=Metabacillus herbersteinensis TaxID=283816 RepID=A0ABV6GB93_9BACI